MSEEQKAVDEVIRLEVIRQAMIEAWNNICVSPWHCEASMLPVWCEDCCWNAEQQQRKIEQALDQGD